MAKTDLTAERVRELLHYDPETGVFTWRVRAGRQQPGDPAGSVSSGRMEVSISKHRMLLHRVAWLYVYGTHPTQQIDHINGNPLDNRIHNLRDVSDRENKQNLRVAKKQNLCGFLGVAPNKKRWMAKITVARKQICLGTYDTPEEAHAAYLEAKRRLHSTCTI